MTVAEDLKVVQQSISMGRGSELDLERNTLKVTVGSDVVDQIIADYELVWLKGLQENHCDDGVITAYLNNLEFWDKDNQFRYFLEYGTENANPKILSFTQMPRVGIIVISLENSDKKIEFGLNKNDRIIVSRFSVLQNERWEVAGYLPGVENHFALSALVAEAKQISEDISW